MDVLDGVAKGSVAGDDGGGNLLGFIGGVVEDLDLQLVLGVVHGADGFDEAIDDELLIEYGELDGDPRQFVEEAGWCAGGILAVLEVEVAECVAMDAIDGEQDHYGEIGQEDGGVEGVPVIEVLEGLVGILHGLEVVAESVVGHEAEQGGQALGQDGSQAQDRIEDC